MDTDTKSLIKKTILGLIGGGAISAIASVAANKDKKPDDSEFGENEIVVPLSRRNFMRAVRGKSTQQNAESTEKIDTDSMTPAELEAMKRAILRKRASSVSKVKTVNVPVTETSTVRNIKGVASTFARDKNGRFSAEKTAGVANDAASTLKENLGMAGGFFTGVVAAKLISDKIIINRKRRQVENSRRKYIDMLSKEVNDEDTPYYSKSASDKGILGQSLGWLGTAGLTTGTIAGVIMYRIMENRRIAMEKDKDKDMAKYPSDKVIKFKFPKEDGSDFFA